MIDLRIKRFLTPILRKAWLRWPARQNVIKSARVERGNYQCNICRQTGFSRNDLQVDHIVPVVDIEVGFNTWDEYVSRLYVNEEELQAICRTCHDIKTMTEQKMRKHYRNRKKKKK